METKRSGLRRWGLELFEGVNKMFFSLGRLHRNNVKPRYMMEDWHGSTGVITAGKLDTR